MNPIIFLFALLVNDAQEAIIYKGDPIIFTISINAMEIDEYQVEDVKKCLLFHKNRKEDKKEKTLEGVADFYFEISGWENWADGVTFKLYDVKTKTWISPEWNLKLMRSWPSQKVLVSEADMYSSAEFSLTPEEINEISAGKYKIKIEIPVTNESGQKVIISTEEINIEILDKMRDFKDLNTLVRLTKYYMFAGNAEKAQEYAKMYLEMNKNPVEGYVLLGDVAFSVGNYMMTLDYYQTALSNISDETPHSYSESLEEKINQLYEIAPDLINGKLEMKN